MSFKRFRTIISWGLVWAVTFVLFYQLVFAVGYNFTPCGDDGLYSSNKYFLSEFAISLFQVLIDHPFRLGRIALGVNWSDPFYGVLIWVPYVTSIQYFVFGCMFGLGLSIYKSRRRVI
jgi:hypothetical protein